MRTRYRLTLHGVESAAARGVTFRELWEVIESEGRMFVPVGGRSRLVAGQTLAGRWIGFLAQESEDDDEVWEIVSARELDQQEVKNVRRARGDGDA